MCNINIKTLKDVDKYFQLGYKYYSGENIPIDKKQAFLYFNYCAQLGNTNAMNICGIMLYRGDGILQNKIAALEFFKKSLNEGNVNAMIYYGLFLKNGDCGLKKNKEEAEKFFKIAEIGSNPKNAFFYAEELEKNSYIEEAILFYKMAAQGGYLESNKIIENLENKLKELSSLDLINNEFSKKNENNVA